MEMPIARYAKQKQKGTPANNVVTVALCVLNAMAHVQCAMTVAQQAVAHKSYKNVSTVNAPLPFG